VKNVKIYDIKSSAAENAKQLFSLEEENFFWDNKNFTQNDIGDIIFFVNKSGKWALHTTLEEKDIQTSYNEEKSITTFVHNGNNYTAKDSGNNYKRFYRFKIHERSEIPEDWNWTKHLGVVQIYDLWRNDKDLDKIGDRIEKVNDLQKLFSGQSLDILNQTKSLLKDIDQQQDFDYQNDTDNNLSKTLSNKYLDTLLAIKTKPFIILAGLSGTGKSRLVRTIAFKSCPNIKELRKNPSKPGNFELIKVRPNWHDSTEVVGYESRLSEHDQYIITDFIRFIVKAWKYPKVPFFLCLDEMNLAPVEQYFAEYLSVFETRKKVGDSTIKTDALLSAELFQKYKNQFKEELAIESKELLNQFSSNGITLPQNLVVMGTVNMDETTHSFSPKVLDRAMTIEKNNFDLKSGLNGKDNDWEYADNPLVYGQVIGNKISGTVYKHLEKSDEVLSFLKQVNSHLKGTPFLATYRVRDEFLIYCYHFSRLENKPEDWFRQALDNMLHMKILPKIEGEADQTKPALNKLEIIAEEKELTKSKEKINQMQDKLERLRYTSYWY